MENNPGDKETSFTTKLYLSLPSKQNSQLFEKSDEEFKISCNIKNNTSSLEVKAEQEKDFCCDCYIKELNENFINERKEDQELAKNIEDNIILLNRVIIPLFKANKAVLYPKGKNLELKFEYFLFLEKYDLKIELEQREIENIDEKFEVVCKKYKNIDPEKEKEKIKELEEKDEKEIQNEIDKINQEKEKLKKDLTELLKNYEISDEEIKKSVIQVVGKENYNEDRLNEFKKLMEDNTQKMMNEAKGMFESQQSQP